MDRINRVVYVDTLNSQTEVCNLFSSCGEIRGLYQWTSEREKVHYFVEFRQLESVNRARVLKLPPETHVHSLAFIPQLIDRFRTLAQSGGDPLPDFLSPANRRHSRFDSQPTSSVSVPKFSSAFDDADFVISTRHRRQGSNKENDHLVQPTSSKIPLPSVPGVALLASPPLSHVTVASHIVLSLCDESIVYDLESLEDDPNGIISLLKLTSCERDKWMVIGGHYRRRGNSAAAITVVTTMIEFMTNSGVSEDDMKPAFLMLSSCYTDLAKRARDTTGANTEASLMHLRQSQEWLQKVYGSDLPLQATTAPTSGPQNVSTSCSAKTNSPLSSKPSLPAVPSPTTSFSSSLTVGRIRILEREIQSLRDRHSAQQAAVLESKSLKRKFEDELVSEKSSRRKAEKKLEQLESEMQVAKRMEAFALEQVKREVETRRMVERREKDLIDRIEEMEMEMKKGVEVGKAVLLEDLASMFQKAAQGENLLIAGRRTEGGITQGT